MSIGLLIFQMGGPSPAASVILIPRVATVAQSNWIHERAVGLTVRALAWDANLMREDSIWNGVLCSLHYEVLFSLLLPTYLLACTGSRRWWAVKLVLAAGLSTVGGMIGSGLLRCMPVLAIGALLAVEWRRIAHRAAAQSPWCWAILFGVAAFLLFSRWIGVPGHWATAAIAATILVVGLLRAAAPRGASVRRERSNGWVRALSAYTWSDEPTSWRLPFWQSRDPRSCRCWSAFRVARHLGRAACPGRTSGP